VTEVGRNGSEKRHLHENRQIFDSAMRCDGVHIRKSKGEAEFRHVHNSVRPVGVPALEQRLSDPIY
jgi:hypothetical protein